MLEKPEPLAQVRARRRREAQAARRRCLDAVWERARARCEGCGRYLRRGGTYFREVGHVHERVSRARGGDPTDPANCLLLCFDCHFNGPSGAHRRSE